MENFLENSTIHGFKYLSKKFHLIERLFWLLSLFMSLILTIILITKLIEKVKNMPIIVQISDNQVHVGKIDFPAVTQCYGLLPSFPIPLSGRRFYKYERHTNLKYFYELEEFDEDTKDERSFGNIGFLNILKKLEYGETKVENLGIKILKRLQVIDLISRRGTFAMLNFSITTDDFLDIINEFKTRASPFYFVIGFNQAFSSFSFVSNIITEKNLCKNYNLAPSIDVFNTNLTADDFNYQHYNDIKECLFQNFTIISLQRSLTSKTFLTTRMLTYEAQRKETISSTKGGSMFFHDPYELHTKFSQNYVINEHQNVEIIIEPQIMEVDESLYDENPISRNCYFDDERKLKLFKVYTKANCQFECMSELMITRCGCVEFFMIRNKTTRICSASEKVCFDKVRKEFDGYLSNCGCLERCNFVKYNIEFNSHDRNL